MPLRIVQSSQNPRLKDLRRVLNQPPRLYAHPEPDSLLGLEGAHLVEEALRANLALHTLFLSEGAEKTYHSLLRRYPQLEQVESLVVPRAALNAALTTEAPQPIAAILPTPHTSLDSLIASNATGPILVLASLQDPGNLGTIIRSAEAFEAAGIIALPGTVSPWNPKALRSSAGSALRLPLVAANVDTAFAALKKSKRILWTTALEGATTVTDADLTRPIALLIGNEGSGIPREIADHADGILSIPTPGPVESLNASVATSILLYEAARQRNAVASAPKKIKRAP